MKRLFVLLFILCSISIFAKNWTYEMETISIPTGTAGNEIYIYDAPDHLEDAPDEGPTKFQIDETGNIYILDERKIKKFDEEGKFIFATLSAKMNFLSFIVLNDTIWATCRDNRQNVFLRNFDQNGRVINSYQIEKRLTPLKLNQIGNIGFVLENNMFLGYHFGINEIYTEIGNYLINGKLEFNFRESKRSVIFPEENIELDLNEIWPNEIGHSLIGFDEEGNLYFNIYSKPVSESKLGIISNSGEVIETNVVFPFYTNFGLDFVGGPENNMSIDGDIYQMIPMKDKIEIRKWKRVE